MQQRDHGNTQFPDGSPRDTNSSSTQANGEEVNEIPEDEDSEWIMEEEEEESGGHNDPYNPSLSEQYHPSFDQLPPVPNHILEGAAISPSHPTYKYVSRTPMDAVGRSLVNSGIVTVEQRSDMRLQNGYQRVTVHWCPASMPSNGTSTRSTPSTQPMATLLLQNNNNYPGLNSEKLYHAIGTLWFLFRVPSAIQTQMPIPHFSNTL